MESFNSIVCHFCSGHHESVACTTYPKIGMRLALLKDRNGCNRCLQSGHTPLDCPNVTSCHRCQRCSHHTALCWNNKEILDVDPTKPPRNELCIFCTRHIESNVCRTVNTFAMRQMILQMTNRCVQCLEIHPEQPCRAVSVRCIYCKQNDHHKAMCPKNKSLAENFEENPSKLACLFCGNHMHTARCKLVVNLHQRRALLDNLGRCHRCLRLHRTEDCFFSYRCFICLSVGHHEALCSKNPKLITDYFNDCAESQPSSSGSRSSPSSQGSSPPNNDWFSLENRINSMPMKASQSFFDFVMNFELPTKVTWTV